MTAKEILEQYKHDCELALTSLSYDEYGHFKEGLRLEINLLERLINEHFNNSLDFKAFNLYSNNTLKSKSKIELINYIHILSHNWKTTDNFYERVVKENEKLVKENDSLTTQLVECQRVCKVKQERIEELQEKYRRARETAKILDEGLREYQKEYGE